MEKIKLRVSGNAIEVTECPEIITSGTIGLPVEFTFDSRWGNLTKLAVFRAGDVAITAAEPGVVPWEVLEKPNVWLQIGVYGVNADGTVAIPTMWVNVCVIHTGVNPDSEVSTDPTLTVWQRVLNYIDKLQADTAPAGFGLGEVRGKWVATPDNISESGFYRSVAPSVSSGNAWYLCISYTEQYKTVFGFKEDTGGLAFMRTMKAGVWGEWEWVNPPMLPGVEYRTTERWNGKPVYTKLVDCGGSAHGKSITIGNAQIIRHSGVIGEKDFESYVLPDMYYASDMLGAWVNVLNLTDDSGDYNTAYIQIYNDTYGDVYNIIVQVWYIKEGIF